MFGFFDRMLGRGKKTGSASTAKERLQFILVHDRIDLPPERLKAMKDEILAVISKYVSVYTQDVEIALEQRDRKGSMLVAEIPFSKNVMSSTENASGNSASEIITEDVDGDEEESILDKLEELEVLEELEDKEKSTSDDNDTESEGDLSEESADADDETSKS
jgi:cell division topological specificity factor